jgi:hypothetical protein
MDTASTASSRRHRRRGFLVLLLTASTAATIGATAMSLALFTDSDATDGSFTTGTIDIALTDTTTVFAVTGMMPGDTEEATLNVANGGTAEFRYAMTSAEVVDADDLGGEIQLTIREGACPSTGAILYQGDLDVAAFGDPTPGVDPSDRVLAGGIDEDLCFSAYLPETTGDAFQGTTVTMTFTFDAEQTANN